MIRLEAIELSLGSQERKVNVLRGLDLAVAAGETIAVEGPSGSGKTSMLMVIAGLERPTGGRVRVDDVELGPLNEDALARFRRDRVGIVFQGFHLIATMTALENVAVPLELAGRADAFVRAREELTAVGLGRRLSHYPGELSGGEQQRVALARAFACEPRLLLADEPSGNLDPDTGHAVMDLMFAEVARRGTTLLLITHDPALALRCGRRLRLVEGRLIDGPALGSMTHG
ncbi:ABC transporter [Hypericibacter terrae]|jgi:putative ABC transport system ATP-binding protein|uniref:ABC transporter n=1 Tax=Hypericibacter terrae TaxID=2602015 RepID=A0A5J6MQ45_9PROT|nr:ATP-binding cassette domain-containing protein [Hypericibacter terrae]QEX19772.1 ABC transporter [Hypericibacter terrae]